MLESKKSLLHSDRFLYMAGGGTGTPGGGGTDDQGRPVTADDQGQPDLETEGLAGAEAAKAAAIDDLSRIKSSIAAIDVNSNNGEIFSEFDDSILEIADHDYNIKYLLWLQKLIETKGRTTRWFLPPEIAGKIGGHVNEMTALYQRLNAGAGQPQHNFDALRLDDKAVRKEAVSAIRDLIGQTKDAREKSRQKLLDRIDATLMTTIDGIESRDIDDGKKDAQKKLVKSARKTLVEVKASSKPFETQYNDRIKILEYLKTHDAMLWESEQDKATFEADKESLTPEGLRAKIKDLRARKAAEVDPYLAQIKTKADQLEAKVDGKVRRAIEETFKDNDSLRGEHLKRLDKVKEQLEGWRNINFFDIAFGTGSVDLASMIGSDGKMLSDEDLKSKNISPGAEDWIALSEAHGVSEDVRKSALLTAADMLMVAEKTMGRPKEVLDMTMMDYDKEIDRYITNITEVGEPQGGYTIYFLSLYDFKHMGEKLVEWAKRKYNRRSDNLLGRFGVSLLSDLPGPLKTAANEFDRLKEQSELDEVNQYKESYSNKDAWQVIEVMHNTRNQDEMKACMYLLADLGRIRWDDPQIWRQLMYFGHGAIQFDTENPENEVRNQGRLHEKLQKIVGVIWDFDTFQTWQSTNESNYSSKMESHKDFCDKNAESEGTLDLVLKQDLESFKRDITAGKVPKIDPQRFEKMINYNIEFGKGSPEGKLYYLIQGVACGLLSRDTASRINSKWINAYPVIDVFGSETEAGSKPTMDDIRRWAKLDGDKNEPDAAFHHWFYTYVMHRPRVYQRVDKALTQGMGQDHDDATCWFGAMSANTAKTILSQNAQGFRMPMTGYQNATVGMLHYLDTIMEGYPEMGEDPRDETSGYSQIIRFANMFTTFDGITAGRMFKERTDFFKWNGEEERHPRSDGVYKTAYGRNKMTTQNYLNTMRGYLSALEPEFFDFLFHSQSKTNDQIQKFCQKKQEEYGVTDLFGPGGVPQNADQLHQSVSTFLKFVLATTEGRERIRTMRASVIQDHRSWEAAQRRESSSFLTVKERVAKALDKQVEPTAHGGVHVPTQRHS